MGISDNKLIALYLKGLGIVFTAGCAEELKRERDWRAPADKISFLRHYAWVVFVSGFRERVIKQKWPRLTQVFLEWNPEEIAHNESQVKEAALKIFNNKRKVEAILKVAKFLSTISWEKLESSLLSQQDINALTKLPFIANTTKYHLAKSLGWNVAKPDIHMRRIAEKYGFEGTANGVNKLAERIEKLTGEKTRVIDYILWRASTHIGGERWACGE